MNVHPILDDPVKNVPFGLCEIILQCSSHHLLRFLQQGMLADAFALHYFS